MSSGPGLQTHTGIWTNWSHGPIHGKTLTLPQQHATILTVFLALYVSAAGGAFWRILSFFLHQYLIPSRTSKRDALFHQRQVVLRNSSAIGAAWAFGVIGWENLGRARNPVLRCLPFVLVALVNSGGFAVAGLFTSQITRVLGNTTIILGPSCGGHGLSASPSDGTLPQFMQKALADTNEAADYVRQCYQSDIAIPACGNYVRRSLPFTTNPNATCPFTKDMCIFNDKSAFEMDTGLLNSHYDFGINAPPEDRLLWRRVSTCAPIYASDFGEVVNGTRSGTVIRINAGPNGAISNYTFEYPTRTRQDSLGYGLSVVFAPADPKNTIPNNLTWIPHSLLARSDADLTLLMLSQNSVRYSAPVDDPWMQAHEKPIPDLDSWVSDNAISLLGCAEQIQICSPDRDGNPKRCSTLTGKLPLLDEIVDLVTEDERAGRDTIVNRAQIATFSRLIMYADTKTIFYTVQGRGAAALNAASLSYDRSSPALPPNQWHKEVSLWFATGLAKEQSGAIEWATMPRNLAPTTPGQEKQWTAEPPTSTAGKRQCRNQLVRSTSAYMNFSVLGVALVLGLGGAVMGAGWWVDGVVGWVRGRRGAGREGRRNLYKSVEWEYDGVLEMQRALYGAMGRSWGEAEEGPHLSVLMARASIPVYEPEVVNVAVEGGDKGRERGLEADPDLDFEARIGYDDPCEQSN